MSRPVDFRSDNVATVSPDIMRAIAANDGPAAAYGDDAISHRLNEQLSALFETNVTVFPVATGTAANALGLSALARPWGGIYCHEHAHIHTAEGGATEAYTHGTKLIPLPGTDYRLPPAALRAALARVDHGSRNRPQPDAVSITQASEWGTVYRLDEIAEMGDIARSNKIRFHMDGARFANALARLGCTPAEMTWRRGVDLLSFGATKNGAMSADAIVLFDQSLVEPLSYRLRAAGQTWSKMRFAAAQLIAYVEDDLYVQLAAKSNALAARLSQGLNQIEGVRLAAPVEANLLFVHLPPAAIKALAAEGALFRQRDETLIRLVTRFDGTEAEVDELLDMVRRVMRAHA
jgi:threonine aldolase